LFHSNEIRLSGDFELQRQEAFGASAANCLRCCQNTFRQLFRSRAGQPQHGIPMWSGSSGSSPSVQVIGCAEKMIFYFPINWLLPQLQDENW